MKKNYMTIAQWAKKHGIPSGYVQNLARFGKLRQVVKRLPVTEHRLFLPADFVPDDIKSLQDGRTTRWKSLKIVKA